MAEERELTDDELELKRWLVSIKPKSMSQKDVAVDLKVSRKTITNMLSEGSTHWPNGYTMLRYLRLAEALLKDPPSEDRDSSRLVKIEEATLTNLGLTRLLHELPSKTDTDGVRQRGEELDRLIRQARSLLPNPEPGEASSR